MIMKRRWDSFEKKNTANQDSHEIRPFNYFIEYQLNLMNKLKIIEHASNAGPADCPLINK